MNFLYWCESIRTPFFDQIAAVLTHLGSEAAFLVVACVIFWCVNKNLGYYLFTAGFAGTVINQFLKITCRVPRPWVIDPEFTIVESARAGATGYSFPSGHTANAVTTFGVPAKANRNKAIKIAACLLILLVGFTRMYLGVHTPADVCTSLAIGAVIVFAGYFVYLRSEANPRIWGKVLLVMLAAALAYIVYVELIPGIAEPDAENLAHARKNAYSLAGALTGLNLVYYWDSRRIKFSTEAAFIAQIGKCVLGIAIIAVLRTALKQPLELFFSGHELAHAVRYLVIVIFAGGIWPLTFTGWQRLGRNKRP